MKLPRCDGKKYIDGYFQDLGKESKHQDHEYTLEPTLRRQRGGDLNNKGYRGCQI